MARRTGQVEAIDGLAGDLVSHTLIAPTPLEVKRPGWSLPEEVGGCVECKRFIFHGQPYGRAQRPKLGKAHTWCGGR